LIFVLCGALAFLLLFAADVLLLRGFTAAKTAVFAGAAALMLAGLVGGALSPSRLDIPPWLRAAGWVLGTVSLALVVLALVVEVPAIRLYLGSGAGTKLVTTGMYAMARHPGVPCFSVFLVSLALATGSATLAVAVPVWIGLDVALVVWQERACLVPVYGDEYRAYQETVPMLVPTPSSIRRGIDTIRRPGEASP
jgi:protein-S-isoprenylcysteine O-methyltransferase Ste14